MSRVASAFVRPSSILAGLLMLVGVLTMGMGGLIAFSGSGAGFTEGIGIIVEGLMIAGLGGLISWVVEVVYELRLMRAQLLALAPSSSDQASEMLADR